MRDLAEIALNGAGQRSFSIEATIDQAAMVVGNKAIVRPSRLYLVFSYFFGQEFDAKFVREISTVVRALMRRLQPTEIVTIYTNIDINNANWIPNGDIHHWYRQFMEDLGWTPRIQRLTYEYVVPKDLELDAENVSSGEVTFDVQLHGPKFADGRDECIHVAAARHSALAMPHLR